MINPRLRNFGLKNPRLISWQAIAVACLIAGIYFRFIGIGRWPFATDEYFLYRSISFILDSGLPEFPCGGYYTRSLLYQYLAAPLLMLGVSPEIALRSIAGVFSLLSLPAIYLLARQFIGTRLALALLIIMSLSVWEVEMARFGRMYAPFQALFIWYLYHAYYLVAKKDLSRWRWLIPMSLAGTLVWEGGIILPIANFLVLMMCGRMSQFRNLLTSAAILVGTFIFVSTDFRFLAESGSGAMEADTDVAGTSLLGKILLRIPLLELPVDTSLQIVLGVTAIAIAASLGYWIWRQEKSITLPISLAVAYACVALNQLLLAALVFFGALLLRWIEPKQFRCSSVVTLCGLMLVGAIGWISYAVHLAISMGSMAPIRGLIGFPDILYSIVYPWAQVMPLMGITLVLGSGALFLYVVVGRSQDNGLRFLLAFLVISVALIGAAPSIYSETRYSFHLYPVALLVTVIALERYWKLLPFTKRRSVGVPAAVVLAVFFLSADFAPAHLLTIQDYNPNFRVGYESRLARHYYPRFDFESPARYVEANRRVEDIVVTSTVVVTEYLSTTHYVYLSSDDPRFRGQACNGGRRERWTGLRLLSEPKELEALLANSTGKSVWLVIDWQTLEGSLPHERLIGELGLSKAYESADGRLAVYR